MTLEPVTTLSLRLNPLPPSVIYRPTNQRRVHGTPQWNSCRDHYNTRLVAGVPQKLPTIIIITRTSESLNHTRTPQWRIPDCQNESAGPHSTPGSASVSKQQPFSNSSELRFHKKNNFMIDISNSLRVITLTSITHTPTHRHTHRHY